jgi:hypothetical protein
MITPELIKQAVAKRQRLLRQSSIILCILGLLIDIYGLVFIFINGDLVYHVVFLFGALVATFGIFSLDRTK